MAEISQRQPNPQPPMNRPIHTKSFNFNMIRALIVFTLILPFGRHATAQEKPTPYGADSSTVTIEQINKDLASYSSDLNSTANQSSPNAHVSSAADMAMDVANITWVCTRDFYYRNKPQIERAAIGLAVLFLGHEINAIGNTQSAAPTQQQSDR